ncbi:MAG TPA: hypothetical protein VN742_01320, partial [Candidatus Binataceae bacterium]|nr:hypothetical protein [Candidatus Binataceae bacterium]
LSPTAMMRWVVHLVRELVPVVLFFFVAFGLIFLLLKLFLAQYSIEVSAFTKAAAGALILGKVVALLDEAQANYRFGNHRPAVVVAVKTVAYGFAVFIFGIGERIFEASRKAGTLRSGVDHVITNATLDRALALVLLITLVISIYLVFQEIDRAMGKGNLLKLFFEPPQNPAKASQKSRFTP